MVPDVIAFLDSASSPSDAPVIVSPGIYAILVREAASLPGITPGRDGVIYIGMTEDGLDARNHFRHAHSGFSTLRRSLGALLKEELGLRPVPRAPGPSRSNVVNYRFTGGGERILTDWMERNLLIAQLALADDVFGVERDAIRLLEPPLNLTGWPNPQRSALRKMRARCVAEAEKARGE